MAKPEAASNQLACARDLDKMLGYPKPSIASQVARAQNKGDYGTANRTIRAAWDKLLG